MLTAPAHPPAPAPTPLPSGRRVRPSSSGPGLGPGSAPAPVSAHGRWRPRIGLVLLGMNIMVLALPLAGLWGLRLYESALIRQTESELITQGAVIAALFRATWRAGGADPEALGPAILPVVRDWSPYGPEPANGPWLPRFATLDLAEDAIFPPAPEAQDADLPAAAAALAAGEAVAVVLREAQRTTLAGVRIVDRNGVVVATTGGELGQSLRSREEVAEALAGAAVSLMRRREVETPPTLESISRGATVRVFTALPVMVEDRVLGAVVLSRTPRTITQALYGKRGPLAAVALVLLAAVGGLATLGALVIARPIARVTAQAKRVAAGEFASITDHSSESASGSGAGSGWGSAFRGRPAIREVAELAAALERMAAALDGRARYIKEFASQVSHEFKTPLSTIRATAELMQDHLDTMTAAERQRFLANIDAAAHRMERLVNRLLHLARAEAVTATDAERTALAPLLTRVAARWRDGGIAVEITGPQAPRAGDPGDPWASEGLPEGSPEGPPEGPVVAMPEDVLETVFNNLLANVRQHAGVGARARLGVAAGGAGPDDTPMVVIQVADNGRGISAANAGRVFDRFFTTARREGGTGLGLAIVRSLITNYGGTIVLVPSTEGAVFEIRLPCASLSVACQGRYHGDSEQSRPVSG